MFSTGLHSNTNSFCADHAYNNYSAAKSGITSAPLSTGFDSKAGAFGAAHLWFVTSPRIEPLFASPIFYRYSSYKAFQC